jgi:hypothetical protein
VKYLLLSLGLFTGGVGHSFAQLSFSAKAGFNLAKMENQSTGSSGIRKLKEGFHTGLQIQHAVSDGWRVESGIAMEQKGSEVLGFYSGYCLTLNYIEIPVLISKTLGKRLAISTGLGAAYLFHARFVNRERGVVNVTKAYKKLDYSVYNTLAYQVKGFEIGGRYAYGIRRKTMNEFVVDSEIQQIESFLPSGRNKVISFYISYRFNTTTF